MNIDVLKLLNSSDLE